MILEEVEFQATIPRTGLVRARRFYGRSSVSLRSATWISESSTASGRKRPSFSLERTQRIFR